MLVTCTHCKRATDKPSGAVNRSIKAGLNIYCSRTCSDLGRRRDNRTDDQKKADKAAYDAEYRAKNRQSIAAKKKAAYDENPPREREKAYRERTKERHLEYLRRPEYRAKKKVYDRRYRAEKFYGDLAEAFVLTLEIRDAALEKAGGDYELRLMKGTLNKALKRKRHYERLDRKEPEECALGNLEQGERR